MTQSAQEPTRLVLLGHDSSLDGRTEVHELLLRVPSDLRWLRGHFDANPVLPAIVQLWEVQLQARAIWPDLVAPRRITRTKFRRPIRPENLLLMRLRRTDKESQTGFEYRCDGEICSSGVMAFRPPKGNVGPKDNVDE